MRSERGMSLAEVTVVMVVMAIVATAAATYTIPWLGREDMRGAVYQVQQFLQLARVQAISRNRSCRFQIDTSSRRMTVLDLNDPASTTDDILLDDATLSSKITFARPDGGSAVTLSSLGGNLYGATFASDGSVPAGAGLVAIQGGDGSCRVSLYGAGGVRVERWNGTAWVPGS
jgi:prepilin-type N-terminal cleavage/methylation domain-containing protein